SYCFTYFFFQAEDGIRDFHVTGVQTCALPIFKSVVTPATTTTTTTTAATPVIRQRTKIVVVSSAAEAAALAALAPDGHSNHFFRSEERRVGKECRARLWLSHDRK